MRRLSTKFLARATTNHCRTCAAENHRPGLKLTRIEFTAAKINLRPSLCRLIRVKAYKNSSIVY
ncbi:hypothetical protein J6590_061802 [Homalodisca vitripennis]|nr:hypothetical protein J6590_061802 [Homalodisca vitripennis]